MRETGGWRASDDLFQNRICMHKSRMHRVSCYRNAKAAVQSVAAEALYVVKNAAAESLCHRHKKSSQHFMRNF